MNTVIVLILTLTSGNITKDVPLLTTFSDIEECDDTGYYLAKSMKEFNVKTNNKNFKVTFKCLEKKV